VIAGLLKIEYPIQGSNFTLWVPPDGIFGLVEPQAECARLCAVQAMERTICYVWDLEGFFTAAGVSWELALARRFKDKQILIKEGEIQQKIPAGWAISTRSSPRSARASSSAR